MKTPTNFTILQTAMKCLEGNLKEDANVANIVKFVNSMDFPTNSLSKMEGHIPAHSLHLDAAIYAIDDTLF